MEIFNYDNRTLQILNLLEENYLTKESYLTDILKVSTKTITNDVKYLNKLFSKSAYIDNKGGNYILYIIKLEKYLLKKRKLYESTENFDSSKVRLVYIFKSVVTSKESYLIDDLAFEMMVSRTTLNNDLKKLNEIIKEYDLQIKGKPNTGLSVKGKEKNKRIFILENIYNYIYKEDIFDLEDREKIDKLFKKYNLDEQVKDEFLKYLTITLDRFTNDFHLEFQKGQYEELIAYYTLSFIEDVAEYFYKKYNVKLSKDEYKFLTICFATMRVPTKITKIKNNLKYTDNYIKLVQEILERVSFQYGLNLDVSDIQEEFIYHIYFLLERLRYGVKYKNNMKKKIKEKYPMSYKMSETAIGVINDKYNYKVSEDELGYLAIYFQTFLSKITDVEKLNVLILTKVGPAYKNLMIRELETILKNVNIDFSAYPKENLNQYNFVITTLDKKIKTNIPTIYQNEIFDTVYLKKEINFLKYVGKMNTPIIRGMESLLLSSMNQDTFFVCDSKKSYKENLKVMIESLTLKKIVDKNFLKRIEDRERKSSMIFSDEIAFPHTINNIGENNLVISLGVSEDGFNDNEKLKLIFLACVPQKDGNSILLTKTYDELISIMKDKKLITNLSKVKTYEDLVDFFVKNTTLYR